MANPYQPSATTAEPADTGYRVDVPGVSARVEAVTAGFFSGWRLLVNGELAPKKGWFGKRLLRADDGAVIEVRYMESLTGPVLLIGKQRLPVGPRHPAGIGVLAFLPFALCFTAGAIGGVFGAAAWVLNRKVASSDRSIPVKVVMILGSTLLATGLTLAVIGAVQLAIQG